MADAPKPTLHPLADAPAELTGAGRGDPDLGLLLLLTNRSSDANATTVAATS